MLSFKQRSYQKEWLDSDDIPFEDIKKNMEELEVINKRLGGHRITIEGITALTQYTTPGFRALDVIEIGCGGGDNLRAIKSWANKNQVDLRLHGIDINPECIVYARAHPGNAGIEFICSDYRDVLTPGKADIIFSSLFCHHFTDAEITGMLQWMQQHTSVGFFINDLHRHPVAYYSIQLLTRLFSRSSMVKNDAPISVLRGFSKTDWKRFFYNAGISTYTCRWKWAFRWLITCRTE